MRREGTHARTRCATRRVDATGAAGRGTSLVASNVDLTTVNVLSCTQSLVFCVLCSVPVSSILNSVPVKAQDIQCNQTCVRSTEAGPPTMNTVPRTR